MITQSTTLHPTLPPCEKKTERSLLTEVAIRCLRELAFSTICVRTVLLFVASPIGASRLFYGLAYQSIMNLYFHSLGARASALSMEKLASQCEWTTSLYFAYFTVPNTANLIHEAGHALAALAVYKNPKPGILIDPFVRGVTTYQKTALTSFGKALGPLRAKVLVIASGPGLIFVVSLTFWILGWVLYKKYPQLSKSMILSAGLEFYNQSLYALSALSANPSRLSHDFVSLALFGLSPLAAAIAIVAIPTFIALSIHCARRMD